MDCKHDWEEETLMEKNFFVVYGSIRRCKKCGREEFADYTNGRLGGTWVEVGEEIKKRKGKS